MLFLITDTSGKHGSVALAQAAEPAGAHEVKIVEEVPLAGGTFSAQLVPQIASLLAKHNFSKTGIGAFVVVSGPGSFTGLRVGLAAIKALAEILHKPIVPVSLLEVVALAAQTQGRILAALDAGRGEVYVGEYDVVNDSAHMVREQLLSRDELASKAGKLFVATPDQALVEAGQQAGLPLKVIDFPTAASIARLGWQKLQAGETTTPKQLEANYIRRSDAEIFAKPG